MQNSLPSGSARTTQPGPPGWRRSASKVARWAQAIPRGHHRSPITWGSSRRRGREGPAACERNRGRGEPEPGRRQLAEPRRPSGAVQVRAGVADHGDRVDLELRPGRVPFPGLLTGQVRAQLGTGQPRVGDQAVPDRVAEVDDPPPAGLRRPRAIARSTPRALVGLGEHAKVMHLRRPDHQQFSEAMNNWATSRSLTSGPGTSTRKPSARRRPRWRRSRRHRTARGTRCHSCWIVPLLRT
jgi:hypothetical protein